MIIEICPKCRRAMTKVSKVEKSVYKGYCFICVYCETKTEFIDCEEHKNKSLIEAIEDAKESIIDANDLYNIGYYDGLKRALEIILNDV